MNRGMIAVEVVGLSTSPASGGAFILVLGEMGGARRLPIVVGENEATAIVVGIENRPPPRPMSHDLFCSLIEQTGIQVVSIVIDGLKDGTFYAKIRFVQDGNHDQLDSRPSDAVAIAVRLDADIFVAETVLDEAGIPMGEPELPTYEDQTTGKVSPTEELEQQLARAIEKEDYEEAARLRDALAQIKEPE